MVAAKDSALQHRPQSAVASAPRPLPLFLDMVRRVAGDDADLARRALAGMRVYAAAPREPRPDRPVVAHHGRVRLIDCGGSGTPVVLVPSLINPSAVLDLAPGSSLCGWLSQCGYRAMLVDWGDPGQDHGGETLADHVADYLVPLISQLDMRVHLVGYCLGGTMALAACRKVNPLSLTLLATPWHFDRYGTAAKNVAGELWKDNCDAVFALGCMPLELLQSLFWAIDERRCVAKYAALAGRDPGDPMVRDFALLEDWSNSGAPLTAAAAQELFELLITGNRTGDGSWSVAGQQVGSQPWGTTPAMHFTARQDRIAPSETAPDGIATQQCPAGHVGMVVGSRARDGLWQPLVAWLNQN